MNRSTLLFTLAAVLIAFSSIVQAEAPAWITVETADNSLVLGTDSRSRVYNAYYGSSEQKPEHPVLLDEAYPCSGGDFINEPALRAVHADGNTSTVLVYQSHKVEAVDENTTVTRVELKDEYYPFYVTLVYKAYKKENLIAAHTVIHNKEDRPITVYQYASQTLGCADTKNRPRWLTQFCGSWNNEANMVCERLNRGIKLLDSKRGVRAHEMRSPFFLLSDREELAEDEGGVLGVSLAWSGSFSFYFEIDENDRLTLTGGANPFASQLILEPGEELQTPELLSVWSGEGTGKLSRCFHQWARKHGLRDGMKERSILLNNWEATFFSFDQDKLAKLFRDAKEAGFELFLLDDGWFGNKYPRNDDKAGLGDWQANVKKLPEGVPGLCREAERVGIPFGIWVEPEMVNPKSELYEKHPDWAIGQLHRPLHLFRNQLILDLTNPVVQKFSYDVTADLLKENPYISFIKWDANRYVSNGGSRYLPSQRQSELIWRYHQALYENMSKTARDFPNIRMMLCSGGGGRVDYKALSYFHEFWPSDNTNPADRIFIQWGFSHFYPAISQACHVTSAGDAGIKYAFDVAMSGRLGMDYDLHKMSREDFAFTKNALAEYKKIRPVVQFGDLYRLVSPYHGKRCSLMYVDAERAAAVLFVYQMQNEQRTDDAVKLKGLDPEATYSLREINRRDQRDWIPQNLTGKELMEKGFLCPLNKKYDSLVLELTRQ